MAKQPSLAERELLRRAALAEAGTPYVPAAGPSLAQRELLRRSLLEEAGTPYVPAYERTKPATKAEQKQAAAIRNAFTLGAPSDDRQAKARAMAAQAIFNDLERSKASPEELAAAKKEADSWANWASLPKATRENILSRGRRQAELGNAESKMADVMRERQTPGAEELLRREAVANAGGPRITGETIENGRVTKRQVTGKYGSGSVVDTGVRGAGDPRLRAQTEQLLLDQAAQAGQPPSYAAQVLADYQSRINPQGAMPQQVAQVAPVPVAPQATPRFVNTRPMGGVPLGAERIMGGGGSAAFSQLAAPPIESYASPVPVVPQQQVVPVAQPIATNPAARAINTLVASDLANPDDVAARAQNNFAQSQAGQALWNMTGGDAAKRTSSGDIAANIANTIGDTGTRFYAGLGNAIDPVLSQARYNLSRSALGQLLGMTKTR